LPWCYRPGELLCFEHLFLLDLKLQARCSSGSSALPLPRQRQA